MKDFNAGDARVRDATMGWPIAFVISQSEFTHMEAELSASHSLPSLFYLSFLFSFLIFSCQFIYLIINNEIVFILISSLFSPL